MKKYYQWAGVATLAAIISFVLAKSIDWDTGYGLGFLFVLVGAVLGTIGGIKRTGDTSLDQSLKSASRYDVISIPLIIFALGLMYFSISIFSSITLSYISIIILFATIYFGWFKTAQVIFKSGREISNRVTSGSNNGKKTLFLLIVVIIGGLIFWYFLGGGYTIVEKNNKFKSQQNTNSDSKQNSSIDINQYAEIPTADATQSNFCHTFPLNLNIKEGDVGDVGSDVFDLNQILAIKEKLILAAEEPRSYTIFASYNTTQGIKKFQAKYNLPNSGVVDRVTVEKLNEIYGCPKRGDSSLDAYQF
jgi:hypothetical protein